MKNRAPKTGFCHQEKSDKINRKQEIKNLIKELKTENDVDRLKGKAKAILGKYLADRPWAYRAGNNSRRRDPPRNEKTVRCSPGSYERKYGENGNEFKTRSSDTHFDGGASNDSRFYGKTKKITKKIKSAKSFDKISEELKILKSIAEQLVEADKHHQREEEVLFPMLEKFGVTEPPEIMREEHEELKARKKNYSRS